MIIPSPRLCAGGFFVHRAVEYGPVYLKFGSVSMAV